VRLFLAFLNLGVLSLADLPFSGLGNHMIGLVAKFGGDLPVRRQHFVRRQECFFVAGVVGRNLRGLRAAEAAVRKGFLDLLTPWAGRVKIFLRVSLDLRRAALARLDFVAEIAEPVHQLRLIHGSRVALRSKEAALLKRAHLAILTFGHIEDDGVRMELWSCIPIDRPRRIVLERGGDKLASHFRGLIAADPRLRISL